MNEVSYILTFLVICVLFASGSPSTSVQIKVRGTVIRNGQSVVRGVAGTYLKIVCLFKSGIPGIKFFMNINGVQRERNGSGRLRYSFKPTKSDNMKSFACSGRSPLLDTPMYYKVLLDIQYSPVVNVVNEVTEKGLTLNCNPSGNPDNYTFANWQHWSEFREHIQNMQGTPEGSLVIREPTNSNRLYENDGIYTCKTSNGVYGANGLLYQKGSALIHNRVAPIFMNANDPIQFGCYGQDIYVSVLLYNKYGTLQTTISNNSKPLNKKGIPKTILMRDMFHGVKVTVAVINITFQLTLDEIDDFTDYTIKACNNKGCNVFTVKVTSKCRPEAPPSVSVNTYARYLNVGWNPGFDGGYLQTFFVEYRQETKTTWKRSGPVVDNGHVKMSKILNDLKPKTRYQVRVFSTNEIGDSNQTVVTSLMTLDNQLSVKTSLTFQRIVIVVLCILSTVLGAVVLLYVRYLKQKIRIRMISPTTEASNDETAHYTEINDEYRQNTLQENDNPSISTVNIIGDGDSDTAQQFLYHLSASSDNRIDNPENYDDDGIIVPTNIPTEASSDERTQITEIIEDNDRQTTLQENDRWITSTLNSMYVGNTDTASQFSEHSSSSSDQETYTSGSEDDGYEKPYTTLMVQHCADNEHVYLATKKSFVYENLTPFEKASCELTRQNTSQDETKSYLIENDDDDNKNQSFDDSDVDKKDNDFNQSRIDPPKYKAEYINLMLK